MDRLSTCIILLGMLCFSLLSAPGLNAKPIPRTVEKSAAISSGDKTVPTRMLLLDQMGGVVITPHFIADNIRWIETEREFLDGLFVRFNSSFAVMKDTLLEYSTVAAELAPLNGLKATTLIHNFAVIFNDNPGDVFDDWSVVVQNWVNFARAANEAGFEGIFFDNEEYFGRWTDYPDNCKYQNKSLKEYQDQVRLRGKEIMQAVMTVWPDVAVITAHGPSISEPKAPAPVFPQWQIANELKGPFFIGFMEGMGENAMDVDGGELYTLRTAAEFSTAYRFQKNGIASAATNCAFLPADLRSAYPGQVSASYGIYNQPFGGKTMDANTYGTCVFHALNHADHYIWLYPEQATFLKSDGIGQDWIDAVRAAKNEYMKGFSTSVKERKIELPGEFRILGNHPNPFNPTTTISFRLSEPGRVQLSLYTIGGQNVRNLVSSSLEAGLHSVVWDGCDRHGLPLPSGAYLSQLVMDGYVAAGKMVLVR